MASHQIVCVGPSLAGSLKPLAHHQNVASLSFFIAITLVDVYLNWLNWFHFLILVAVPLVILIGCIIFLSPFLDRYYKDVYVNSFFPRTARPWNSLPAECFPLTALSVELIDTIFPWDLSLQLSSMIFIFFFSFLSLHPS